MAEGTSRSSSCSMASLREGRVPTGFLRAACVAPFWEGELWSLSQRVQIDIVWPFFACNWGGQSHPRPVSVEPDKSARPPPLFRGGGTFLNLSACQFDG